MRDSGLSDKDIQKHIQNSKEAMVCHIPEELHYFLTARFLGISSPKPQIKSKFIPTSTTIKISDIKDENIGTYVTIEGKIMTIFSDTKKVTFNITDLKKTIRCTLFDNSNLKFRNEKFKVGDNIRLESAVIKEYKGLKELKGNEYTSVIKIKE
jgi:DNA replicative helicase MCM subunit Mcm2 (Cdc46/Mcm family)